MIRYEVIADYPNSPYMMGDILVQKSHPLYADGEVFGIEYETDVLKWTTVCKDYPHIFRLMHWADGLSFEELPMYVKIGEHVMKVIEWRIVGNSYIANCGNRQAFMPHWGEPATETEYLNYINSKK